MLIYPKADLPERVVGMEFKQRNEERQILHEGFDADSSLNDLHNPYAGAIYAINFNEA